MKATDLSLMHDTIPMLYVSKAVPSSDIFNEDTRP